MNVLVKDVIIIGLQIKYLLLVLNVKLVLGILNLEERKIKMPEKLKLNEKKIIKIYKKGESSITKIAKKFNCSTPPIYKILKKNKIKRFPKGFFNRGKPSWRRIYLNNKKVIKF